MRSIPLGTTLTVSPATSSSRSYPISVSIRKNQSSSLPFSSISRVSRDPPLSRSALYRASQMVELFPAVSPEVVVREARIEDCWEVGETHCSSFFPEYSFPLDFVLRLERLVGMMAGFSIPAGCRRTCLVAVIAIQMASIALLQRGRTTPRIRLRVLRVSETFSRNKTSNNCGLDIVAADQEGDAIHLVIDGHSSSFYKEKIKEGKIYTFTNLACIASLAYRPVDRSERLRLTLGSRVIEEEDNVAQIKHSHFEFLPFSQVSSRVGTTSLLTDVIGVLCKVVNPAMCNSKNSGEGCFSKFYIRDLSGNELPITLWGSLNVEFRNLNSIQSDETIVVALCSMIIKKYEDEVYASNLSLSKLYINLDIPEVTEYFDRFNPMRLRPEVIDNSGHAQQTLKRDSNPKSKTISNLLDVAETGSIAGERYLCSGKISGFNVDKGWFYSACRKCTSKLEQTVDGFFCKKCSLVKIDPMPWYKIDTIVEDESGSATFTAFGECGTKLIGAPVSTLVSAKVMDPECLHPLMERIIGERRTFEVSVKRSDYMANRYHINVHNVFIDIVDKTPSSSTSSTSEESFSDHGKKRGFDQNGEDVVEPFPKKFQIKIEKP